jgi:uncharacterized membrane protein YqaE (UPF0057 family)
MTKSQGLRLIREIFFEEDKTVMTSGKDICKFLLVFILPPTAVALELGFQLEFWISILLTLCGHIPGMKCLSICIILLLFEGVVYALYILYYKQ